jgi:hypothetical protein
VIGGRVAEGLGQRRVELAPGGDDEVHASRDLGDDRVEGLAVGRIGHGDHSRRALEAKGDCTVSARRPLREQIDRLLIEIELSEIDEFEIFLLGQEPGKVSFADESLFDEDFAQPPLCRPRACQSSVEIVGRDQARANDELAERQVTFVIRRRCHCLLEGTSTSQIGRLGRAPHPSVGLRSAAMLAARLTTWAPVVLWAGLIFALSAIPDLATGLGTWDLVLRKLAHAAEYAVLGALVLRALSSAPAAVLVASAYAVTDEVHQAFVSGRHGSPVDWVVDTAGAILGVALATRLSA